MLRKTKKNVKKEIKRIRTYVRSDAASRATRKISKNNKNKREQWLASQKIGDLLRWKVIDTSDGTRKKVV